MSGINRPSSQRLEGLMGNQHTGEWTPSLLGQCPHPPEVGGDDVIVFGDRYKLPKEMIHWL